MVQCMNSLGGPVTVKCGKVFVSDRRTYTQVARGVITVMNDSEDKSVMDYLPAEPDVTNKDEQ